MTLTARSRGVGTWGTLHTTVRVCNYAVLQGIVSICRVMIFGTILVCIKRTKFKHVSHFILFPNSLLLKEILDIKKF